MLRLVIKAFYILALCALSSVVNADVFTCGKATGSAIYSLEGFRVIEDGLSNSEFRILVTPSELSVLGVASNMKTVSQTPSTISAIATTSSPMGEVLLLYTFDRRRKVLYISTHKDMIVVDGSGGGTYLLKCK